MKLAYSKYFMRSIFVSHWSIIPSMTFIRQIVFKIHVHVLGKITQPWNIGHTELLLQTQKPMSYGWPNFDILSLEVVSMKEKAVQPLFMCPSFFYLQPHPRAWTLRPELMEGKQDPSRYICPKYDCFLMSDWRYTHLRNFNIKFWRTFH